MLNPEEQLDAMRTYEISLSNFTKKIKRKFGSINVINVARDLHKQIDNLVDIIKSKGVEFACKKGCSLCCNIRVEALAPEVFYIARVIKSKLSDDELVEMIAKLKSHAKKAKDLRLEEYDIPCPMLENDICSIYDIRPAMCRKYNSLDSAVCSSLDSKVPESMELVVKTGMIGKGFSEAFENKNLSASPHEFGQALLLALTDETAERKWKQRETVFVPLPEVG